MKRKVNSRIKKNNKKLKQLALDFEVKSVKDNDTEVVIRGLANANVVDRGNEKIATDAWQLDNFKKNPVILLNHGFDIMGGLPIGRATSIKPTENGLEIEARISKSNNGALPMVRDLITDGFLSTFSVGFDLIEGKELVEDGKDMFLITKAELFEVSVVGVPMNQDSTFTVTQKDLKSLSKGQIEAKLLRQKGCHIQANVLDLLVDAEFSLDAFLKSMVRRTKKTRDDLHQVMIGKAAPDALFLQKAAAFLDCTPLALHEGNEDLSALQDSINKIEAGADPKEVLKALHKAWHKKGNPCEDKDDDKDGHIEDDEDDNDDKVKFVTGETEDHTHSYAEGDETTGETNEHTHAIAEDGSISEAEGHSHGADPEATKENDDDDNGSDDNSDDDNADADKLKDFQECVNGKIPTLMDDGMEQDEAVANAIESCASEKSCDIGAFKNTAYAACFEAAKAYAEDGAEWKGVDFAEIKQALAEGEDGNTTPIDTELKEQEGTSDPHLMAAQQSNVLLGTMINKFDQLLDVMAQQNANTEEVEEEDTSEEAKEQAKKLALRKRIALARRKQLLLQERVNALGIG